MCFYIWHRADGDCVKAWQVLLMRRECVETCMSSARHVFYTLTSVPLNHAVNNGDLPPRWPRALTRGFVSERQLVCGFKPCCRLPYRQFSRVSCWCLREYGASSLSSRPWARAVVPVTNVRLRRQPGWENHCRILSINTS